MKIHNISIINIAEDKVSTAANSRILIDGEELHGVKEFNLNIKAGSVAEVTFTMHAKIGMPQYMVGKLEKIVV